MRASGSSLGYIAWLMVLQGAVLPLYAAHRLRGAFVPTLRPFAALGLLGSALSVLAYRLVLWARTRATLAPVAALRESSVKRCSSGNNLAGKPAGQGTRGLFRPPARDAAPVRADSFRTSWLP